MTGYPALSALMCSHPEDAIFRTFTKLNIQSLLYAQAELCRLESELLDIASEDRTSNDAERRKYDTNWSSLAKSPGDLQWKKVQEIRKLLAEYNTSLLQLSQLRTLSTPSEDILKNFRKWLEREHYGDSFLGGSPEDAWDKDMLQARGSDLVVLSRKGEQDWVTGSIAKSLPLLKRRVLPHKNQPDHLYETSEDLIMLTADGLVTIVSACIPALSILVLHRVTNITVRLGLVVVFSALFATALLLAAKPRRIETFAATTAFAAVQVVFVGSTDNKHGS